MPPSQEQPIAAPKQGIKWNEVTWYSKLAAIVVLLGMVPTLCFYIGAQYELTKKVFISPVSSQNSVTSTPSPLFQWVSLSTLTDKSRWFEENGKVYFKRYFNKILLPTANSQTFVVAVNQEGSSTLYAKDATTVYDGDTIFNNVDLGSFTPIFFNQEATSLSKDKSHVYDWAGGVISDVDPISVVAIGIVGGYPDGAEDEYFRDKNGIYFDGFPIAEADMASFKVLDLLQPAPYPGLSHGSDGAYGAYDRNYKYSQGTIVATSSTNSVKTVLFPDSNGRAGIYMKDQNFVYLYGSILEGADSATFTVIQGQSNYDAYDKNHKYVQGKVAQ